MKKVFIGLSMILCLLTAYNCSQPKDPAAYNNELMTVINDNEKHINDMNAAMTAADYSKASEVRKAWETSLSEQIAKVEKAGDFNGDEVLQKGILSGLKAYQKIVTNDYPKLIDIRANKKEDPQTEQQLLENINNAFETAANDVNKASNDFESKYAK
uniref:Lipoprotein n=1 Tax=Sphingobacterium sp. (strain 21) TaxID=743722 RepID=F4C7L3_SPHS2